jgi:hypothetical protein
MGSVGIKVSQPNYPVESAEDYKLLFSSSWPNLNIVNSGRYVSTNTTNTIVTHNLGYRPMFLIWELTSANTVVSYVNEYGLLFEVNETELREKGPSGLGGKSFFYQIYAVDLDTQLISPSINTGSAEDINDSIDRDYGIKVSKPGKSIYSTDFRDYVIHSRTRSPMVGSVSQFNQTLSATITHNYGYAPMAYIYGTQGGGVTSGYLTNYAISPASSNGWSLSSNSNTVVLTKFGGLDNIRVVVLKDPMVLV